MRQFQIGHSDIFVFIILSSNLKPFYTTSGGLYQASQTFEDKELKDKLEGPRSSMHNLHT